MWELGFDLYSLQPSYRDGSEAEQRRRQNWQEAFAQVAGETAVLTGEGTVDQLERKGYKPVKAPESLVTAASRWLLSNPILAVYAPITARRGAFALTFTT